MLVYNLVKKQSLPREVHRLRRPGAMLEREKDARLQHDQEPILTTASFVSETHRNTDLWNSRAM